MLGRRMALVLILVMITSITAACAVTPSQSPSAKATQPAATATAAPATPAPVVQTEGYSQAPMLAEKVAAGALPPVEERLPAKEDILVADVYEEIGQYGGNWRMVWQGTDSKWASGMINEEPLFRFKPDGTGIEPNVAKGYDVNADSTEYTIYLREGMRWSDGEPFTANDVIFYWEHMLLKETFGKSLYDCYYSVDAATGDKAVATFTKIDDYTFKVTHKYPSPLFLERVAIDNKWLFMPEHFFKNILPEFIGEEKALEEATKRGFSDLKALGQQTGYYFWLWADIPTLNPWVATNDPNSDQHIMERNPYYWKVDAAGQQLPYIDRLVFNRTEDGSHALLEAMAGNIDAQAFGISDFTVLKENENKGDYRILQWTTPSWTSNSIQLNQTIADDNLRALFQDIRFREAISIAANRAEIAEIVTNGMTDPAQAAIPEGLANYQKGMAEKWVEYKPDAAKALLDDIGLPYDASGQFRTFADGSELTLTMFYNSDNTSSAKLSELLIKYYEAVGIRTVAKGVDNNFLTDAKYNNELPAVLNDNASVVKVSLRPDVIVPLRVITPWHIQYGLYNATGGEQGMKPEGDVALLLEYWNKLLSSTKTDEIDKWSDEIIKLHAKNSWIIGFTSGTSQLLVVKNHMKNIPNDYIYCDEFRSLGHGKPFQFFIAQ